MIITMDIMNDPYKQHETGNPEDIYFFRHDLPSINTTELFTCTEENGNLRVQNKHVNSIFHGLTADRFDMLYNDFNRHLNLDLDPLYLDNNRYVLTPDEKEKLFQYIATSWLYYYTVNNLPVEIKRSDFVHPYMVDYVLTVIDKKYGVDTREGLALGAKILRQDVGAYIQAVEGRRRYYDR